jgi:hypothetical protein
VNSPVSTFGPTLLEKHEEIPPRYNYLYGRKVFQFPVHLHETSSNIYDLMEDKFSLFKLILLFNIEGSSFLKTLAVKDMRVHFLVSYIKLTQAERSIEADKEIVAYFKRAGLMPLLKSSLKQEAKTRWMSMLIMIQSILKEKDNIEDILQG